MLRCGLLGERLGHSYSPALHRMLGDYEYRLYEKSPEELAEFLQRGDFHGLNVTIPYKKAVVPFCAALSDEARAIGSVNTLVRQSDGSLFGDNTDAFGFRALLRRLAVEPAGKKALVLGGGGAGVCAAYVLRQAGAEVTVISRSGADNYENLHRHRRARLIVNATPVGMFPHNGESPLSLARFPQLEGVADLIYNPARTALLLEAERLGIPHVGGLTMLAAQAQRASELFQRRALPDDAAARAERALAAEMENLILVGMPGCDKSTLAALLGERLHRPVLDADQELERAAGMTIPDIFARFGEAHFRALETETLAALGKRSGCVIATGGGAVLREENYPLLHQNGRIFHIRRDTALLPTAGRPVSQSRDLRQLEQERLPRYRRFADDTIDNNGSAEDALRQILEAIP